MPAFSFRPLGALALVAVLPALADFPSRVENRGTHPYILTGSSAVSVQEVGASGSAAKAFNGVAILPGKAYIVQHGSGSTLNFSPLKNSNAKPEKLYSQFNADLSRAVVVSFTNSARNVSVLLKDTNLGQAIAVDPTKIGKGNAKKGTPFLTLGVRKALNGGSGGGGDASASGGGDASSSGGGDASSGGSSDPSSGGGSEPTSGDDPSSQPDPNS